MLRVGMLFADDPLDGLSLIGEDVVEGVPVAVYLQADASEAESVQQRVYIARENGLPIRVSTFQLSSQLERFLPSACDRKRAAKGQNSIQLTTKGQGVALHKSVKT